MAGYERSGQTRAAYAAAHGISVTGLDYYRRRARRGESKLVAIEFDAGSVAARVEYDLTVVLRNGRRVELGWRAVERMADGGLALSRLAGWLEQG